jgi:hypothetical protein
MHEFKITARPKGIEMSEVSWDRRRFCRRRNPGCECEKRKGAGHHGKGVSEKRREPQISLVKLKDKWQDGSRCTYINLY